MRAFTRRDFLRTSLAIGATVALPRPTRAVSANDEVRLGFVSCGGRAGELMRNFGQIPGTRIVGLCDPDQDRLQAAQQRFPEANGWTDMRSLVEDKNIDAVVIATCNHWHCLAAIWAMEAGKDVYVEKPLSHSQWEGKQTVAAARKYGRICQVGTQQRSDPMQAELKQFLHEQRQLGEIRSARVNRYGVRPPIGRRETPLTIPSSIDYDLWLGPAQDKPIYRDNLQYDWHWDWNTGSGEMGNWGVHVLDDLRNIVFQDSVALPRRVMGGGGRVVWNDAGETPNVHFAYFDTGTIPVVIGLANITAGPELRNSPPHPGPGSGYIAYCDGGRLEGQRGRAVAFDTDGKEIRQFRGNSGDRVHQQNFIDAVRAADPAVLHAEVQVGHDTTGWCNLANIAFLAGDRLSRGRLAVGDPDQDTWRGLLGEMEQLLTAHGIDIESEAIRMSPLLELDAATEQFVGEHADTANRYLKREYRTPFVVPEVTV